MKILYIIHQFYPEFYTGTEKFVFNVASMMQKMGHKVKVITYSFYEDSEYETSQGNIQFKNYSYRGIPVRAFKYRNMPDDIHFGLNNNELARIAHDMITEEMPDIVHVGHPMRCGDLIKAAKLLNVPYIISLTDFWFLCPKAILYSSDDVLCMGPENGNTCKTRCSELPHVDVTQRLNTARNMLYDAQAVISPSKFLASMFNMEIHDLNVGIINHGMRYSAFNKNKKIYHKKDKLTFFYGGTFSHHKGVHILIEAFKKLRSRKAVLKLYGSGIDELYIENIKDMAKEDNRIEFCGVFSEELIGDILNNVDVAVVPSLWYENYPLVLHEALACNVPVITSNVGGMSEKIKDGTNGYLFNIGDAEDLRRVFKQLVDAPEQINALKENINRQFIPTIEQEAYAYERVYKQTVTNMLSTA